MREIDDTPASDFTTTTRSAPRIRIAIGACTESRRAALHAACRSAVHDAYRVFGATRNAGMRMFLKLSACFCLSRHARTRNMRAVVQVIGHNSCLYVLMYRANVAVFYEGVGRKTDGKHTKQHTGFRFGREGA
jgi:hypothetical protein